MLFVDSVIVVMMVVTVAMLLMMIMVMIVVLMVIMIMGQGSNVCDVSGDIYGLGDSEDSDFFIGDDYGDDGDGGGGIGDGC